MREDTAREWPTSRCLRSLRPLKAKITAFRVHCESGVALAGQLIGEPVVKKQLEDEDEVSDSDSDEDVSMDRSLNLEEHVISYKKSKTGYKRRRVTDPSYNDFDVSVEVQEDKTTDSGYHRRLSVSDSTWKQLDDILDFVKQLYAQHIDNTQLHTQPLRLLCAFKIGLSIGKQDREIRNLQEQIIGSQDITVLYEFPHVQLCRKWVMLGHALGYLIAHCPLIEEVLPQLLLWTRDHGLTHSVFGLFLETRSEFQLEKYHAYKEIAESINFKKFDEMVIMRMAIEEDVLPMENQELIIPLIKSQHREHYTECLTIISKLLDQRCTEMASSHSLVETIHSIQRDQLETIELISLFAQIIHPRRSDNIAFLTSCFHSCKRGYRSLIPSLRAFKSFLTHTPVPVISPSNKIILRTIFKPGYKITPHFVRYTVKSDTHLALRPQSTNITTHPRSKISTGDLI